MIDVKITEDASVGGGVVCLGDEDEEDDGLGSEECWEDDHAECTDEADLRSGGLVLALGRFGTTGRGLS